MRSLTWVGVSGSNKGCRKTHRIASVSPISCPASWAEASSCFNSLILLAISESIVSPVNRANCSTIGPQCEICSFVSVSCFSSSLNLSVADSYILIAVSSAIRYLYKTVHQMSTVISYIFTCYSGVAEENVLPRVTGWSRHLCLRLGLDNTGLQPLRLPIPCHLSGQPSDRTSHPCPHPSVIPTENRTTEGEVRLSGGTPT